MSSPFVTGLAAYWLASSIWLGAEIARLGRPARRELWIVVLAALMLGWVLAPLRLCAWLHSRGRRALPKTTH